MQDARIGRVGYVNFRDLGGHETSAGRVRTGRVFRSDSLAHLAEPDVEHLVGRLGVRTVVDLRGNREVEADPLDRLHDAGVRVHHVPLRDPADRSVRRVDWSTLTLVERYLTIIDTAGTRLLVAVALVADAATHPVVVQCTAGKDRTGLVAAITLGLLGVPDDAIVDDYTRTAAAIELLVERVQALSPPNAPAIDRGLLAADADTMRAAIAHLREGFGSLEGYARAHGFTDERLADLRDTLLEPHDDELS
jgi:protein-tyrosine phosphatase